MKNFITLILFTFSCICYGQQITFLGVPLAGNISDFTTKLAAKGIRINKDISSRIEEGVRAYDVTVFPYPCLGKVDYNTSTKNVYEADLMFYDINTPLEKFTAFVDNFAQQIEDKYNKGIFTIEYEEIEYKSFPGNHYKIYSSKNNKYIGEIYLYIDIQNYDRKSQLGKFALHVMYRNNEAPGFEQQMQEFY